MLFSWWPIEGSLNRRRPPGSTPHANGVLDLYDFGEQKLETLVDGITSFEVSIDPKTLIYRLGNRFPVCTPATSRTISTARRPAGRAVGWIWASRAWRCCPGRNGPRCIATPGACSNQFWSEDMQDVDWQRVYRRYWPLVGRVATAPSSPT